MRHKPFGKSIEPHLGSSNKMQDIDQKAVALLAFGFHLQGHGRVLLSNMDIHQVRAAELRHVACFFARDRQQSVARSSLR